MSKKQTIRVVTKLPPSREFSGKNTWTKSELIRAAERLKKSQQREEAWIRKHLKE